MNWEIDILFIGNYESSFDKDEEPQKNYAKQQFKIAITNIIQETGITPIVGDWINPGATEKYLLDIGRIAGRDFYADKKIIRFEIE